jgi:hypothetical protein
MSSTDISVISANQGTFIVNDTTEKTASHDAIVVLEDTVFTSIKIGGVDVKDEYISTPGTAVKAGAIIRPYDAKKFSGVQLASGSVAIVI